MSNYNNLKTTIDANIKQNGNQEITGPILNSVLNQMVNILGTGYQFAGVAVLDTDPGTPDAKVFYIANDKGKYEKFGGINVTEDDVVVLYWDTAWHKVSTGIASQEKLSELDREINGTIDERRVDKSTVVDKSRILPSLGYVLDVTPGEALKVVVDTDGNWKPSFSIVYKTQESTAYTSLIVDCSFGVTYDVIVPNNAISLGINAGTLQYATDTEVVSFIAYKKIGGLVDDINEVKVDIANINEDVAELDEQVNGSRIDKDIPISDFLNGYWRTNTAVTGQTYEAAYGGTSDYKRIKLSVKAGEKYRIYGYSSSSTAGLYVLTNIDGIVITYLRLTSTSYREIPAEVVCENDGYLYINLNLYAEGDKVVQVDGGVIGGVKDYVDGRVAEEIGNARQEILSIASNRILEFTQGNKLIHENKRHPFSWGSFTPAILAIKSDDLTHDVDLVAKIMADNDLPLHLAAPIKFLDLPVDGIIDESQKIGYTRLDVVRYVIAHGGEIMEHSDNTFTSPLYDDPNGIYPIFIEQQKKWTELGINVRGAWVANVFPTDECKAALEPYLYYYYEYSNGYANDAPYSQISKINDGSQSSPTTEQEFKDWIDTLISQHGFGTLTIHGFTRITQSVFEAVLAYVRQKITSGELLVKTWGEVYDERKSIL